MAFAASVSLVYQRPEGPACPDEGELRQLVASKLGLDPFTAGASSVVTVRVSPAAPWTAEVLLEQPGANARRKTLSAATCEGLLQSVALTVALVLDPVVKAPEPAKAVEPTTPRPIERPSPPPAPEPPRTAPSPSLAWSLAAGGEATFGLAVGLQPEVRLEGRARSGVWSVGVEGRYALPSTGTLSQGALTTSAVVGAVVPCLHWRWLAGCVDVTVGGLRLEGTLLSSARAATVFHASVGLRAVFAVPVGQHLSVGALLEGQVPLTRASAVVGTERVWTVWALGASLGLFLALQLPE